MELRHLRYFVTVAEELHFTRAAQKLGIAQPPLSRQIRELEEELGVELFERAKRHIALTTAGKTLLVEARQMLSQAQGLGPLTRQVARGERGWLGVGFVQTATYGRLPQVLRTYRTRFPQVELELADTDPLSLVEMLLARKIHVAAVRTLDRKVEEQAIVIAERVQREELLAALPEDHPVARAAGAVGAAGGVGKPISLAKLSKEGFIIYGRGPYYSFMGVIRAACEKAGFEPAVVQHTREIHTALSLVTAGLGVTLVPASVQAFKRPGLSFHALAGQKPMTELLLVHHREDANTPTVNAFLEIARGMMSSPRPANGRRS